MAKSAKDVDHSDQINKRAGKFLQEILAHYENIETARGRFMNAARKERDGMQAIYEGMAALGVSQRSAKTNVKIARALARIDGWLAELADEDNKMAQRLAKAQQDKRQLMFWTNLPKQSKPKKAERYVEQLRLATGNGEAKEPAA